MLIFNKSSIDLLAPLICDADFSLSALPKTTDRGVVTFKIRRPFWENQQRIKRFFIKQTVVKEIFSEVTIGNITGIKFNWKDDIYNKPDDRHTIRNISVDEEKNIKIETETLTVNFSLDANFKIKICDTSTPKGIFLRVFGWRGMDYHAWREEYNQRTIV